jgi:hypothetical protein
MNRQVWGVLADFEAPQATSSMRLSMEADGEEVSRSLEAVRVFNLDVVINLILKIRSAVTVAWGGFSLINHFRPLSLWQLKPV